LAIGLLKIKEHSFSTIEIIYFSNANVYVKCINVVHDATKRGFSTFKKFSSACFLILGIFECKAITFNVELYAAATSRQYFKQIKYRAIFIIV
jgi:hypothetical protein